MIILFLFHIINVVYILINIFKLLNFVVMLRHLKYCIKRLRESILFIYHTIISNNPVIMYKTIHVYKLFSSLVHNIYRMDYFCKL